MGFLSAAFGIPVGQHDVTLEEFCRLFALEVYSDGKLIPLSEYSFLKEEGTYDVKLRDDFIFSGTGPMLKELTEEFLYDIPDIKYKKNPNIVFARVVCRWYIGFREVCDCGETVEIDPSDLADLEELRLALIKEKRIPVTGYSLMSNCCS
jgi:hypothetical protein